MAKFDVLYTPMNGNGNRVIQWTLTDADPTGDWQPNITGADRTVQVIGTFGGGTVTMQGTNEVVSPANPVTLKDDLNTAVTFTAAGARFIRENMYNTRPVLSGSTGATVTVLLCTRG